MDSFVDLGKELLLAKWESVVEALLPRRLLGGRHTVTPWRACTSPPFILRGAYGVLRQKALPSSLFVVVFSTLVGLSSLSCLAEVTRFLYVCSLLKSSLESSRTIFSAAVRGWSAGRTLCRDLALEALAALVCDLALPHGFCESLLVTQFLLEASVFCWGRGEKIFARSFKGMGSTAGAYAVAPPCASKAPSVHFEGEECCVLSSSESFALSDFAEDDELQAPDFPRTPPILEQGATPSPPAEEG